MPGFWQALRRTGKATTADSENGNGSFSEPSALRRDGFCMSTSPLRLLLAATLCTPCALTALANQRHRSAPGEKRIAKALAVSTPRASSPTEPAKGRFLVASHKLVDPNFSETVVLLFAYEASGAMGVVINRPADVPLRSVLGDVEELRDRSDPLYLGGPVAPNFLLVLLRAAQPPESSQAIFDGVYVSASRAALREALLKAGKTNRVRAYAGYASWGAGQLDREIARGDWHVTAADPTMVFETKASAIWPTLIQQFSGEWTRRRGCPGDAVVTVPSGSVRRAS
jgi:putative transcriptional regulator